MKSGIYKITNIVNSHIYIGSGIDYKGRFRTHLSLLRKGNHHSLYLQRAWNKYKEKSFKFELIEYCEVSKLLIREQFFMDELNPEYNVCKIAGNTLGFKGSVESNKKKSENHSMRGKFGKDNRGSKLIYQYSLDGKLLNKWYGSNEIERVLSFNSANIRNSIKNNWTLYNFYWTYEDRGEFTKVPQRKSRELTKKPVLQISLEGVLIREWDSAKSATTSLGKGDGALSNCLKDENKTAYGYKWKYKKE